MLRSLVCSVSAATLLLLADGLAAQSAGSPRLLVVPQVGAAVHQSADAQVMTMASLAAEVPVGRGVSLMVEGTAALTDQMLEVCLDTAVCAAPTGIRSGATAGVVVRPFQLGRVTPYAGVSGGVARWAREDLRGTAPLASLRAGVDVRVAGPFGVRADLVRRIVWADESDESPVRADVLSIGASFALRR
jgi:hypothetical protein